jgi:hypothetical protein
MSSGKGVAPAFRPHSTLKKFLIARQKNGALDKDPLWRRSGAISPFQGEKI